MAEPLIVDTPRLEIAGDKLRSLVFPQPPSSFAATGTDPVSAAINETMPVIESPVVHGLPAAKAALDKTASKIASAAAKYAEADQTLGEKLGQHQFLGAVEAPAGAVANPSDTGAPSELSAGDREDPLSAGDPGEQPDDVGQTPRTGLEMASQLSQFATIAGTAGTAAQSVVQGVQGAIGSAPASGQSPADQPESADETDTSAEDEEQEPGTREEGAAPGEQAVESVPLQGAASSTPTQQPSPVQPAPARSDIDL